MFIETEMCVETCNNNFSITKKLCEIECSVDKVQVFGRNIIATTLSHVLFNFYGCNVLCDNLKKGTDVPKSWKFNYFEISIFLF